MAARANEPRREIGSACQAVMHHGYHLTVTRDISNIFWRQITREFMETVVFCRLADTDAGIIGRL